MMPKPKNVRRSQKQEKRIAKEMQGRTRPASGALPTAKGDVVSETYDILVEAKLTEKLGYRITRQTIRKIRNEALRAGKNFMLQLDFIEEPDACRLAVVDYDVFLMMLEELYATDEE
jgi:hypothetical protein